MKKDLYRTCEKRSIYIKRDMGRDLWYDTIEKKAYTKDFYKTCEKRHNNMKRDLYV